jgi:GMP synthase (glutamine-hydrolysing)
MEMQVESVAILDAGAQFAKVIDRKVRELKVKTEILPLGTAASEIQLRGFNAIIISGGPESVYNETLSYDKGIFELGLPVLGKFRLTLSHQLGICFGMQVLAFSFGGKVEKREQREDGQFTIQVDTSCPLFDGMSSEQSVLLTHGDSVVSLVYFHPASD